MPLGGLPIAFDATGFVPFGGGVLWWGQAQGLAACPWASKPPKPPCLFSWVAPRRSTATGPWTTPVAEDLGPWSEVHLLSPSQTEPWDAWFGTPQGAYAVRLEMGVCDTKPCSGLVLARLEGQETQIVERFLPLQTSGRRDLFTDEDRTDLHWVDTDSTKLVGAVATAQGAAVLIEVEIGERERDVIFPNGGGIWQPNPQWQHPLVSVSLRIPDRGRPSLGPAKVLPLVRAERAGEARRSQGSAALQAMVLAPAIDARGGLEEAFLLGWVEALLPKSGDPQKSMTARLQHINDMREGCGYPSRSLTDASLAKRIHVTRFGTDGTRQEDVVLGIPADQESPPPPTLDPWPEGFVADGVVHGPRAAAAPPARPSPPAPRLRAEQVVGGAAFDARSGEGVIVATESGKYLIYRVGVEGQVQGPGVLEGAIPEAAAQPVRLGSGWVWATLNPPQVVVLTGARAGLRVPLGLDPAVILPQHVALLAAGVDKVDVFVAGDGVNEAGDKAVHRLLSARVDAAAGGVSSWYEISGGDDTGRAFGDFTVTADQTGLGIHDKGPPWLPARVTMVQGSWVPRPGASPPDDSAERALHTLSPDLDPEAWLSLAPGRWGLLVRDPATSTTPAALVFRTFVPRAP